MPTPRSKKSNEGIDLSIEGKPAQVLAAAYTSLKESIKHTEKQISNIRPALEKHLKKHKKVDANGTHVCELTHQGVKYLLLNVKRQSVQEKPGAIRTIKKLFPKLKDKLIEQVEILRIDRLEQLINKGEISEADAKKIVTVVDNYAFQVKKV